jgi:hypothetical protein
VSGISFARASGLPNTTRLELPHCISSTRMFDQVEMTMCPCKFLCNHTQGWNRQRVQKQTHEVNRSEHDNAAAAATCMHSRAQPPRSRSQAVELLRELLELDSVDPNCKDHQVQ